tara:strand:+ start:42 stop:479 length:438 start_codon:yes stop_codon:yes gene_type:complete
MTFPRFELVDHPTNLNYTETNPHPKKERHGDCGVRAISLALNIPYEEVWTEATKIKRQFRGKKSKVTANYGLGRRELWYTLIALGHGNWKFKSTPNKYFTLRNLPDLCIALVPGHWTTVKSGEVYDSWDCRGKRLKQLRGYFAPK